MIAEPGIGSATLSRALARKTPGREEPVGCSAWVTEGGHHHVTGTGHRVTDAAIAATLKQPATKGADALRLCTSRGDAALPGQEAGASPKERESWVTASPGGRVRDTE